MGAAFEGNLSASTLDLIERIMELEEEFGIEMAEDDFCRWLEGGDWLNGAPVPRQGPPPTLPGAAEAEPPGEEAQERDQEAAE
jgi:hypothetical protein